VIAPCPALAKIITSFIGYSYTTTL